MGAEGTPFFQGAPKAPLGQREALPKAVVRAQRARSALKLLRFAQPGQAKARNRSFEAAVLGPAKHLADRVRGSEARAHFPTYAW